MGIHPQTLIKIHDAYEAELSTQEVVVVVEGADRGTAGLDSTAGVSVGMVRGIAAVGVEGTRQWSLFLCSG
jgi:hypothetical protein